MVYRGHGMWESREVLDRLSRGESEVRAHPDGDRGLSLDAGERGGSRGQAREAALLKLDDDELQSERFRAGEISSRSDVIH